MIQGRFWRSVFGIEGKKYDRISEMLSDTNDRFIFLLDERDSIFYIDFMREQDKKVYLSF